MFLITSCFSSQGKLLFEGLFLISEHTELMKHGLKDGLALQGSRVHWLLYCGNLFLAVLFHLQKILISAPPEEPEISWACNTTGDRKQPFLPVSQPRCKSHCVCVYVYTCVCGVCLVWICMLSHVCISHLCICMSCKCVFEDMHCL